MNLPELSSHLVEPAVRAALAEDLGRAGDITSQATIPAAAQATALFAARKEPGVLAGLDLARQAFELVDPALIFEPAARDGESVAPGAVLARIEGSARAHSRRPSAWR